MAAATIAVEVMREHGERTRSRLETLTECYAETYGEDPAAQVEEALDMARRLVIGFEVDL